MTASNERKRAQSIRIGRAVSRGGSYGYEIASTIVTAVGMGEGAIYPRMHQGLNNGLMAIQPENSV
jgi:PadR family transcriptional regulator PadR